MLRPALVEIAIEPQAEFAVASADRQALRVALDEVEVLPAPVEHLEVGVEFVQQRLARAVKVVRHVQRAGRQGAKYIVVRIFDHYQDGTLELVHLPVQRVQREAVQGRAEHERPRVTLGAGRQVGAQFFAVLLAEDLCLADQIRDLEVLVEGTGREQGCLPVVIRAHRQNLRLNVPRQPVDLGLGHDAGGLAVVVVDVRRNRLSRSRQSRRCGRRCCGGLLLLLLLHSAVDV